MNFTTSKYLLLGLIVMIFTLSTYGQIDFTKADSIAENTTQKFDFVEDLAIALTKDLETDLEKSRTIYMWIVKNIRYDCKKYHNNVPPKFSGLNEKYIQKRVKKWEEEQTLKTMRRKKGICADYSRLFKAMCGQVGIDALIILGDSRDFRRSYRNNHDNPHAWNAIKLDGEWKLVDATWGAGYADAKVTKFTRRVTTGYFLTPPELFILNHLPDDKKWQLLETTISKKEFSNQPMINYGDDKFKIVGFSNGVLQSKNDKKQKEIWLEFEKLPKHIVVADRKNKRIDFQRIDKNGKTILTFSKSVSKNITVFGGNSLRGKMIWLARYEM